MKTSNKILLLGLFGGGVYVYYRYFNNNDSTLSDMLGLSSPGPTNSFGTNQTGYIPPATVLANGDVVSLPDFNYPSVDGGISTDGSHMVMGPINIGPSVDPNRFIPVTIGPQAGPITLPTGEYVKKPLM